MFTSDFFFAVIFINITFFHSPAPKEWDTVWIGLYRKNPTDPSDAYFMWDVGGFIDAAGHSNVYPFSLIDPGLEETTPCVFLMGWHSQGVKYLLGDVACDYPSRFICEKV